MGNPKTRNRKPESGIRNPGSTNQRKQVLQVREKLNVSPSIEQIVFNLTYDIAPLTSIQKRRLDLLLLSMKHYFNSCKVFSKNPNMSELQTKLQMQWKIEHCFLT